MKIELSEVLEFLEYEKETALKTWKFYVHNCHESKETFFWLAKAQTLEDMIDRLSIKYKLS